MTEIIGPNWCSSCGGEYGEHESDCKYAPMTEKGTPSETPLPPYPECDTGPNAPRTLERWGIKYQGPREPHCIRMDDGYWTPWHVAEATISSAQAENDRLTARLTEQAFNEAAVLGEMWKELDEQRARAESLARELEKKTAALERVFGALNDELELKMAETMYHSMEKLDPSVVDWEILSESERELYATPAEAMLNDVKFAIRAALQPEDKHES
jgi:hypothetical protein